MQPLRLAQPRLRRLNGHRSSRRQRRLKLRLDRARPRPPSTQVRQASRRSASNRPNPYPPQSRRHRRREPPRRSRWEVLGSQKLQPQHLQGSQPSMNLRNWIREPANWLTSSMATWSTLHPIHEPTVTSLCLEDRHNGEPIQGPSAARGAIPSESRFSSRVPTRRSSSCSTSAAPCDVFAHTRFLGSRAIFNATHGITTNQCIR